MIKTRFYSLERDENDEQNIKNISLKFKLYLQYHKFLL